MSSDRPVLGRGLNALIPSPRTAERADDYAATMAPAGPLLVPVGAIRPNPHQPRNFMDPVALEELAASIREHGVLQPLLVTRAAEAGYVLVAGERRWRAAQLAGLQDVPVVLTDTADADLLIVALVENLQRQDLSPLEEAHAYARLIERFGLSQDQLAKRMGRSRVAVTNALRLLQLPTPILLSLAAAEISEGHARAILGAPSEEQRLRLWERVRQRNLTVRQTEGAARRLRIVAGQAAHTRRAHTPPGDILAQERLQAALGTRVQVERRRKGGAIVIQWYSDEQFESIVTTIQRAAQEAPAPAPEMLTI